MKPKLLYIAALTALFTGCTSDDGLPMGETADKPITIATATMDTQQGARAAMRAPQRAGAGYGTGELTEGALALYYLPENTTAARYVANCGKWTYADGWQFEATPLDSDPLLWAADNGTATWFAFYPYQTCATALFEKQKPIRVAADQTEAAAWTTADTDSTFLGDVLFAKGTHADGSPLTIHFGHLLAKVRINLTLGTEVESGWDIASVILDGTCLEANFVAEHYGTDTWPFEFADDATTTPITPLQCEAATGCAATYEALVIPHTYWRPTIKAQLKKGGETRTFTKALDETTFQSNTIYTINVQVGADTVSVSSAKAAPWVVEADAIDLETN